MSIINQPTIYNTPTIYNGGGGGGGGGSGLPDGYKRCAYIEYKVSAASVASNLNITDVSQKDKLLLVASIVGGDSGYNYGLANEFVLSNNQLARINLIYNTVANVTRLQSFWNNIDKAGNPGIIECGRNGSNDQIFINENVTGGDDRNNDIVKLKNLLIITGGNYQGSKVVLFEIIGEDGNKKHSFIPAKTDSNVQIIYDEVTGDEYPLNTAEIVCGPEI